MSAMLEFAEELKLVDKLVRRLDRAFIKEVWAYGHEREAKDRNDAAALENAQEYLHFNMRDSFKDRVRKARDRALKRKEIR